MGKAGDSVRIKTWYIEDALSIVRMRDVGLPAFNM